MTKPEPVPGSGVDGVGSAGKRWTGFCESLINAVAGPWLLARPGSMWEAGMHDMDIGHRWIQDPGWNSQVSGVVNFQESWKPVLRTRRPDWGRQCTPWLEKYRGPSEALTKAAGGGTAVRWGAS